MPTMKPVPPRRKYVTDSVFYDFFYKKPAGSFAPLYGVFEKVGDDILGYCENSFSMSFENDRVAIMGKSSAIKDFETLTKAHPKRSFFIARLSRRNGPIKIDWEKRASELASGFKKHTVRNAPFSYAPRQRRMNEIGS